MVRSNRYPVFFPDQKWYFFPLIFLLSMSNLSHLYLFNFDENFRIYSKIAIFNAVKISVQLKNYSWVQNCFNLNVCDKNREKLERVTEVPNFSQKIYLLPTLELKEVYKITNKAKNVNFYNLSSVFMYSACACC